MVKLTGAAAKRPHDERMRLRLNWVDIAFGLVPAVLLFWLLGIMGWVFDLAYLLSLWGSLVRHRGSTGLAGLWMLLLPPLSTAGVIALFYVALADESKLGGLSPRRRGILTWFLALSIPGALAGGSLFLWEPVNRTKWNVWLFAALACSASAVAGRQINRLRSL
jgi:hypothetical protein